MANKIVIGIELSDKGLDGKLGEVQRKFKSALTPVGAGLREVQTRASAATASVNHLRSALVAFGGIAAFRQVAQFGIDLDRARNAMATLTGGIEQANKKMAQLRELAKTSPGVTQSFAVDLFNRLKAVGGIADDVINKTIKSLGKLSTVFADVGPEFSRNLIQIFSTSFERDDIKQALNAVPIFEQLLESAFGTKDPNKLRKLKEAGKLTLNTFLTGISSAIDNDARMKLIGETLGGRLQKQFDEVKNKLAPLGEKILKTLIPALDKLIPVLSKVLDFFNAMPDALQATTIGFVVAAPAIITVAGAIKTLAGSIGALSIAGASPGFAKVAAFLGTPAGAFGAVGAAAGLGVALSLNEFEDRKRAFEFTQKLKTTPLDLQGKPLFTAGVPAVGDLRDFRAKIGALDPTKQIGAATPPPPKPPPGGGTGTAKAARDRFINDFGLNDAELLRHEAELARIRQSNADVVARREREKLLAERPAVLASFNMANQERLRQIELESLRLEENTAKKALEELKKIEPVLSNSERFMKGFEDATIKVGDAFDRLGQNVANAFTNIKTLFQSLKQSVLQFFNDILGSALQNLVKSALAPIFGGGSGGGVGGIGNFLNNLFRGSSFGGGGGLTAPPSVSLGGLGRLFGGAGSSSGATGIFANGQFAAGLAGKSSFLGGLGQSFAAAAPLAGLALGAGLGGPSKLGNVLGGAGGLIAGTSVAASLGLITSGPLLAALPFAAPFAIPLLIGSFFLGRAKQRGKDEEAAGQLLLQAQEQIRQLKAGIANDSIDGSQARLIFDSDILGQFKAGIGTLKTKSVRESRLANQVADLRKMFDSSISPEIAAQLRRRENAITHSKLIPEFATGGIHSRGGLAILHPGEMVLNQLQQHAVIRQAGPQVFDRAGVPGIQQNANFPHGGIMPAGSREPIIIEFNPVFVVGKDDQTKIFVNAGMTSKGRQVIINQAAKAKLDRSWPSGPER